MIPDRTARTAEGQYDRATPDDAHQIHVAADDPRIVAAARPREDVGLSARGAADTNADDRNPTRTITGAIKALFRMVAKVLATGADEPRPGACRRRGGETEGDLRKPVVSRPDLAGRPAARGRYAALRAAKAGKVAFASAAADTMHPAPPMPDYDAATEYLSDTLDWLDDSFDTQQDRHFPQP